MSVTGRSYDATLEVVLSNEHNPLFAMDNTNTVGWWVFGIIVVLLVVLAAWWATTAPSTNVGVPNTGIPTTTQQI